MDVLGGMSMTLGKQLATVIGPQEAKRTIRSMQKAVLAHSVRINNLLKMQLTWTQTDLSVVQVTLGPGATWNILLIKQNQMENRKNKRKGNTTKKGRKNRNLFLKEQGVKISSASLTIFHQGKKGRDSKNSNEETMENSARPQSGVES